MSEHVKRSTRKTLEELLQENGPLDFQTFNQLRAKDARQLCRAFIEFLINAVGIKKILKVARKAQVYQPTKERLEHIRSGKIHGLGTLNQWMEVLLTHYKSHLGAFQKQLKQTKIKRTIPKETLERRKPLENFWKNLDRKGQSDFLKHTLLCLLENTQLSLLVKRLGLKHWHLNSDFLDDDTRDFQGPTLSKVWPRLLDFDLNFALRVYERDFANEKGQETSVNIDTIYRVVEATLAQCMAEPQEGKTAEDELRTMLWSTGRRPILTRELIKRITQKSLSPIILWDLWILFSQDENYTGKLTLILEEHGIKKMPHIPRRRIQREVRAYRRNPMGFHRKNYQKRLEVAHAKVDAHNLEVMQKGMGLAPPIPKQEVSWGPVRHSAGPIQRLVYAGSGKTVQQAPYVMPMSKHGGLSQEETA